MGQAPSAFELEKIAAARSDAVIVRDLTNMAYANSEFSFGALYPLEILTLRSGTIGAHHSWTRGGMSFLTGDHFQVRVILRPHLDPSRRDQSYLAVSARRIAHSRDRAHHPRRMPWKLPKMLFMINRYFVPAFLMYVCLLGCQRIVIDQSP